MDLQRSRKSLFQLLLKSVVALVAMNCGQEVLAQRQPFGVYEWEAAGEIKMRGVYFFEADGVYRFVVHTEPPFAHAGRWEIRQGDVVVHAGDGSEQTYRWQGSDLVLVANTTGMPSEPVVLKRRVRGTTP